ncbi:MAG: hypothetical protein OEY94_04455 [Alphaproteobacteria bacterium]|nr:hypothetical protein [Alphaproteobacteria bacterium]
MLHRIFIITFALVFCASNFLAQEAYAEKKIPIPPERPKILNVPSSYLEELSYKGEPVSEKNLPKRITSILNPENSPSDVSNLDIFDIIESEKKLISLDEETNDQDETLISFPMAKGAVKFDADTIDFLRQYAMQQIQNDGITKIEIRAYATKIAGEEHSKIRISLARSLEIRQFLIDGGINPKIIKLNTLGDQNSGIDKDDRIDLILRK